MKSPDRPLELVLYGRAVCGLCEEMADAVLAIAGDRVRLVRVDIDDDPALQARYSADVPVLCLGDDVVSRHVLDEARLRHVLDAAH